MKLVLLIFNKSHLVLMFLLISGSAIAQHCGVGQEFHETLKQNDHFSPASRTASISPVNGILYIPLTIHFVRHTNGSYSKNNSLEPLYHSLLSLNRVFSGAHIQFYINGNIDYVNNDAYLYPVRDGAKHMELLTNYNNANTANIWILDGWSGSPQIAGLGGPSGVELADLSEGTVIHEFGHFFTLIHTFDFETGIEMVKRVGGNCSTAGDQICDTEADPSDLKASQLIGEVLSHERCVVTSNTRDLTNDPYTPPFDNFMSYYDNKCGFKFTPQQYERMVASIPLYHSSYTDMQVAGLSGAPASLKITANQGYDEISWSNSSGSLGTIVEYSTDGGTSWTVMNGVKAAVTKSLLSDVRTGNTYLFRARHLNSIAYSASVSYTATNAHPVIPIVLDAPETDFSSIGGVSVANTSLNKQTNIQENYTFNTFTPTPGFFIGGNFNLNLKAKIIDDGNGGSSTGPTCMFVYLDENSDGDFDDAGEVKYQETKSLFSRNLSVPILISSQATPGYKRMRIRSFSQFNNSSPYAMYNYTETEDYLIKLVADGSTINPIIAQYNTVNKLVELTWTDLISDYNYTIERSTDGINFTTIHTTSSTLPTTFTDTDILPNTQYSYRVKHTGGNIYSQTADAFSKNYITDYCIPQTINGCTSLSGIDEFSIPSISFVNNSSGNCAFSGNGYSNEYPNKTIFLTAGINYSFGLKNNQWGGLSNFDLYLDVNQNGIFETSEKLVTNVPTNGYWAYKGGAFTVPASSFNGTTRLRIRAYLNSIENACALSSYGETEDYKVVITGGQEVPVINPAITVITADKISISWNAAASAVSSGYTIKISTDGISYLTAADLPANQTTYVFTDLTSDTRYFIQIISSGTVPSVPKTIWAQTLKSSTTTDVDAAEANTISVYPNPVSNNVTIIATGMATLVNSYGQLVHSAAVSGNDQWTLQGFAPGIYFLYIKNDEIIQVIKIIKN